MCAIWINYTKRHYDGTPTDSKAKEIAFNSLKLYTHSNKLQTGCSATVSSGQLQLTTVQLMKQSINHVQGRNFRELSSEGGTCGDATPSLIP